MRFDKFMPCPALQPFVKHYVLSENDDEQSYKVIPGTSLVLGVQYRGSLHKITRDTIWRLYGAGVTGLQDAFQVFRNSKAPEPSLFSLLKPEHRISSKLR